MRGSLPLLLVDGYNVLLALARGEGLRPEEVDLPRAKRRLAELLTAWADARRQEVILVWDGGACPPPARGLLREIAVERPAEADDWIVTRAVALATEGRLVTVATADRGIHRRLPRGTPLADLPQLAADLLALAGDPISLPGLGSAALDGELPASNEPIDTRSLPRRRRPTTPAPEPTPASSPHDRARTSAARTDSGAVSEAEERAREAARERKRRRRQKYLRSRARSRGKR